MLCAKFLCLQWSHYLPKSTEKRLLRLLIQHSHQFYPASCSTFSSILSRFLFNIFINLSRFLFNIFINFIPLLVQHFHLVYPASYSTISSILSRFLFYIFINFIPLLVQHCHQRYPASSSTFSTITQTITLTDRHADFHRKSNF